MELLGIWLAAFLTLAIFSFLYADNPVYRVAEHLYVGVSAGYLFALAYSDIITPNIITPLSADPLGNWFLLFPILLSIMLLLRLVPGLAWTSRMPLAFIIGATAGINFINYMRSNVIEQVANTIKPIIPMGGITLLDAFGNLIVVVGVITGLFYFFFSKAHTGAFGAVAKVGIYFLMVALGASFGYTVMGRISLLIGRFQFLFGDWLGILT